MPQTRRRRIHKKPGSRLPPSTRRHIGGIIQLCAGVLLFLVLRGRAGMIGQSLSTILIFFFGKWSIIAPIVLVTSGLLQWALPETAFRIKRGAGLILVLASFLGLMHIGAPLEDLALKRDQLAGVIGFMVSFPFIAFASRAVGYTVLTGTCLIGFFMTFEPNIGVLLKIMKKRKIVAVSPPPLRVRREDVGDDNGWEEDDDGDNETNTELNIVRPTFAKKSAKEKADHMIKKRVQDVMEMRDTRFEKWEFPTYDLLDDRQSEFAINDEELKKQARLIEEKLEEFDIVVTVRDARPGPTVTQFTVDPSEGVKLSKIGNLKNDLALALAAPCLRIEAPIPGKSLVGIEMPNKRRTIVHLKEILESPEFSRSKSALTLPLGRDVSGDAVIVELGDMPHLLIAGATNSGKSVCINALLLSLLYQNAPHELKLLLIDPKRVELMPYDGIPHLLHPVITDAEKSLQAFRWAVAEMGRRLHRFSDAKVRNIDEYNEKAKSDEDLLPRIIIVIDELADLMMRQFRRDTETMIVRIAQMARAVGINLIISTQRPSVDVITGLIKANIPTRIAFRTVSSVDSRTILDCIGAEDLLGEGDMLYMAAATPKPVRIQGIYVSTKEVERVINAVKIAGGGRITEQINTGDEDEEESGEKDYGDGQAPIIDLDADDNGGDDLFFEAVRVVKETKKASASLLQRQLKVGYARAARLLDIMMDKGLIGPVEGAKPRKIHYNNLEKVGVL